MAARAAWKGTITLGGGMLPVHVEAVKATDKYAGDEPLKDLCACHEQPLDRSHRCAATMQPPAGKVKGVEKPDGSLAILSEAQVQSIKDSTDKEVIEPLALCDRGAVPLHTSSELWHLRANRKLTSASDAVEALYAALDKHAQVLTVRVVKDGRQHIVAIHAAGGVLCANRLRYVQELREPEDDVLGVGRAEVASKAVEMLDLILGDLPRDFNIATVEDEAVARKQAAIAAALSGGAVATTEVPAEPVSAVPDLMANLQAAIDAKGKKPDKTTKRASAKERVTT